MTKGLCPLGSMLAHTKNDVHKNDHVAVKNFPVWSGSRKISGQIHYFGWKLVSPLYARIEAAVHAVEACIFLDYYKGQDRQLCWEGDDICLLGRPGNSSGWFPTKGTYHQRRILHTFAGRITLERSRAPPGKIEINLSTFFRTKCQHSARRNTPYSSDLTPSDFHLFLMLKKGLARKCYCSRKDVINMVGRSGQNVNEGACSKLRTCS